MPSIPPLTPLSQSIVTAAQLAAHRRHLRELGLSGDTVRASDSGRWDNTNWVPLICADWNQSAQRVSHLLGVTPPSGVHCGGKATNAVKAAENLIKEVQTNQARLQSWAARVQEIGWTQAQILQVMEEIEPTLETAFYDEQRLAAAAVGGYASLLDAIEKTDEEPGRLSLDIVSGLPSPDAALVDDLINGGNADTLRQRYGHRGDDEMELATSRLGEQAGWAEQLPAANDAWQPQQAQRRREQAVQKLLDQTGWLQRGNLRRALDVTHALAPAHAQARDALAQALSATRRWVLTAAREGLHDGRLLDAEEIFWLELEEIKQMMTGEWHSRDQITPILQERKAVIQPTPARAAATIQPLGIAGDSIEALVQRLDAVPDIANLVADGIACLDETTPAWAALYARASGVIVSYGDFLCHAAAVGRGGGIPTLVAAASLDLAQTPAPFLLEPARFGPATAN